MKSIQNLSLAIVLTLSIFSACKSDSRPPSAAPPSPATAPPPSPKPEVYLYAVSVDKLNLRDQSNKNGKVLAQFAEGAFVEGTGEISANKEVVTLREIPYNEPYFKVKSVVADQQPGWAYSAALEPIYAGPNSTRPDLARLTSLAAFLKTLPATKMSSGKKAVDYVKTNLATASGTLADGAFILLQNFLFRVEIEGNFYTLTETVQWTDADYEAIYNEKFDMNKYPLTKSLAENSFRLETGEGMVYPIIDWAKLADFFAGRVTPPMKQYILQTVAEQKDNAFEDGGIIIGLDTLAERAIFWEKFNQQNPYFVRSAETRESERWWCSSLLMGDNNTPAFDYENQTPMEEFKKAWAMVLQKYPGSKLAKEIKELSDLIAAEGGKRTKKVDEWLAKLAE